MDYNSNRNQNINTNKNFNFCTCNENTNKKVNNIRIYNEFNGKDYYSNNNSNNITRHENIKKYNGEKDISKSKKSNSLLNYEIDRFLEPYNNQKNFEIFLKIILMIILIIILITVLIILISKISRIKN